MSRTKLIPGQNDLATTNPGLAAEWHPAKNGDVTPQSVSAGSNKKIWWQCKEGHEWQSAVCDRQRGTGCPHCNPQRARRLIPGQNDLQSVNPALALQWHPTKNGDLVPAQVTANSNLLVWWRCANGHEWQARIFNRNRGTGCPDCKAQERSRPTPGQTDLQTTNPRLASQWHPTKNGDLLPSHVTASSSLSVWWQCEKGHEWQDHIITRNKNISCPYCTPTHVRRLIPGQNDLLTVNPNLAAQWHPTKNDDLTPAQVTVGSSKKVWWQCENGHEWEARILNRTNGANCPFCANAKKRLHRRNLPKTVE